MSGGSQTIEEEAFEAVRGATEWLVGLRRSADLEGFDPFGDGFTDYENGFVSVAEGLTGVLFVRRHEEELEAAMGTDRYSDDLLEEDLTWLLNNIEEESFRATPYLDADDTENFTDGVSFALSALLEARKESISIDDERIDSAISSLGSWLIENTVETSSGLGWAWCGSTEMAARDDYYPAQTYFTYSGVIALVDLYTEAPELVEDEDELLNVLGKAKQFLIDEYRVGNGYIEFEPTEDLSPVGYDQLEPSPSPLSTSYTIWAACYLTNQIDEVELTDEERDSLKGGMDYLLTVLEQNLEQVYAYSRKYQCRRDGATYYEGTAPYTLLNTLMAFAGTVDYRDDEIAELIDELVVEILDKCWAGSIEDPEAGFRHFRSQEIDSEKNIIAIYASEVAIESLLAYGVDPPDETPLNVQVSNLVQEFENDILETVRGASENTESEGSDGSVAEVERRNANVIEQYLKYNSAYDAEFQDLYISVEDEMKSKLKGRMTKLTTTPRELHTSEFVKLLLDECYFCSDLNEFKDRIDTFEQNHGRYLFLPFQEILTDLKELDSETVSDPFARKRTIEDALDSLQSDIAQGYDPEEIANDFNEQLG